MNMTILVIVFSQILFTTSDLLARNYMPKYGFSIGTFLTSWFLVYFIVRTAAMFGQLYVLSTIELGKTLALFGAISLILANSLGILVLKEYLSPIAYVGVSFAVIAFIILAFK